MKYFIGLLMVCTISLQAGSGLQHQSGKIYGAWQTSDLGQPMKLILNADGTGKFDDDVIRFTTQGSRFSMTVEKDNETLVYHYKLEGDTLVISGGDLEKAVTFHRLG